MRSLIFSLLNLFFLFIFLPTAKADQLRSLGTEIRGGAGSSLQINEGAQNWDLEAQGKEEILDFRVYGVNPNPFREQKRKGMYITLPSHVLMVGDREFSNEVYRRDNCEAKAANRVRGMFVLTQNDAAYSALDSIKNKQNAPKDSRVCATLKGYYYGVTHFTSYGNQLDRQLSEVKMTSGPQGLNPKIIFVASEVQQLPCER